MTPEERALRDAFLAEMWPTCPELPREEREVKRALDAAFAQPVDEPVRTVRGPSTTERRAS